LRILAIDTALWACAACVLDEAHDSLLGVETMPMERGHAEALVPLIGRVVRAVEGGFAGLDRVAVTIGPGSFTGLRVGIAAARAIGLAARVPVVGVTTLSALLAVLMAANTRRLMAAAIDARHGAVFFQAVARGGVTVAGPALLTGREAVRAIGAGPVALIGSGALLVAAEARVLGLDAVVADTPAAPDIALVARLGLSADPARALPKPLYLRAPDAKPQDAARLPRR
jgi:tRNA threonylcarbamoyladenosine biosynthesis protein TsaB